MTPALRNLGLSLLPPFVMQSQARPWEVARVADGVEGAVPLGRHVRSPFWEILTP